jgi:hypothetical protein
MRNAQNVSVGKPVGIRPLWRPMHKGRDSINHFHDRLIRLTSCTRVKIARAEIFSVLIT